MAVLCGNKTIARSVLAPLCGPADSNAGKQKAPLSRGL
ncbi:hypothetical protein [Pseudomonas phage vB_Pae_BR213a]|nr:hypothetical protein [Pseudomonas phage vB_Pae_BR213a]